jgi:signal transduction histidine kinase
MPSFRRRIEQLNTSSVRWLAGFVIGLAIVHFALYHRWGPGYIPFILPGYAVVMNSITTVIALAIALLAFGRYHVTRDPAAFWNGVALGSYALFSVFDSLTAPGVLPGGGSVVGHQVGLSSWFWHLMFTALGAFTICRMLVAWPWPGTFAERWWLRLVVAGALVVVVMSVLLIAFQDQLPALLTADGHWTPLNRVWNVVTLVLFITAALLMIRQLSPGHRWISNYFVVAALLLTFALTTDLIGTRVYDTWWYWRRVLFVAAFAIALVGALTEYVALFTRERDRTNELLALQSIGSVLMHEVELAGAAQVIVDQIVQVLHVDVAELWLRDLTRPELTLVAWQGHSAAFVHAKHVMPFDAPQVVAMAARTEHVQAIDDVSTFVSGQLDRQTYLREGLHSVVAVPLCTRDHLVGVLICARRHPGPWPAEQLSFIASAAGLFAVTIDNRRLYEALRQALRLREEFIAAAAHELRSPVTVIQGRAQLTLKVDAAEPGSREAFEAILRAAKRIDRLVDDLLSVLRVRPGATALHRERADLADLAASAAQTTAQTTDNYTIAVSGDRPLAVDVDRSLICEVLYRLLENAMRYQPGGGEIRIATQRRGADAVVSVTNRGVGVPLERQPFVFEPFYEAFPGGTPGYTGIVSLGLYLSKQIVEAHGGRIWLVSVPMGETTFSFSVPLAVASGESESPVSSWNGVPSPPAPSPSADGEGGT